MLQMTAVAEPRLKLPQPGIFQMIPAPASKSPPASPALLVTMHTPRISWYFQYSPRHRGSETQHLSCALSKALEHRLTAQNEAGVISHQELGVAGYTAAGAQGPKRVHQPTHTHPLEALRAPPGPMTPLRWTISTSTPSSVCSGWRFSLLWINTIPSAFCAVETHENVRSILGLWAMMDSPSARTTALSQRARRQER